MRVLRGHTRDVRAVAYAPDGRLISGGGADRTLRVWDVATGQCAASVKAAGPVYAVAAAPAGDLIAYAGRHRSGAATNYVHFCRPDGTHHNSWDLKVEDTVYDRVPGGPFGYQYEQVHRVVARTVWSVAYSADGKYLAAACRVPGGGNIPDGGGGRFWRPGTADSHALDARAYAVAFAPDGHQFAVARRYTVEFFAAPGGPVAAAYTFTVMWPPAVAFVPGADAALVACGAFVAFVNPARSEKKPPRVKTGIRTVAAIAVSPDGRTALLGGRPGTIEEYDVATRERRTTYDFGIGGVHSLAYAPDGLTFAAAGDAGLVVCDAAG